jgi:hypothetical protein
MFASTNFVDASQCTTYKGLYSAPESFLGGSRHDVHTNLVKVQSGLGANRGPDCQEWLFRDGLRASSISSRKTWCHNTTTAVPPNTSSRLRYCLRNYQYQNLLRAQPACAFRRFSSPETPLQFNPPSMSSFPLARSKLRRISDDVVSDPPPHAAGTDPLLPMP